MRIITSLMLKGTVIRLIWPSELPLRLKSLLLNLNLNLANTKLTFTRQDRARDLVGRMTLEEKIQQLGDQATGVSRLGIPLYNWWSEALHGVSDVGHGVHFDNQTRTATSFPTVILSAASFNDTLWNKIGQVVSDEARALHNAGLAGLTYWSPTINVARDPRWGRITETPGEDPIVIGRYAANYVRGLQDVVGHTYASDPNERPLKVGACCKHYTAYDLDNWKGINRFHFDAQVSKRDLVETFNRPFEMCVKEGDAVSVMCSYNSVNGIPTCADPVLLNQTIRGQWNLHGYVVADCDSVEVMVSGHHYLNDTPEDAVAQAFKAGLELDCLTYYQLHALAAVQQKKLNVADIDNALVNLYVVLMRLGWFDGSPGNYGALGRADVCKPSSLELSADAARQGIVLLKNERNTLPLNFNGKRRTFAVVGPHARATKAMIGNYAIKSGETCRYSIPADALAVYGNVKVANGCLDVKCKNNSNFAEAIEATKGADVTFIFVGLDLSIEREGLDRESLMLPGFQDMLIKQVVDASTGPVILVILSAGGIDVTAWKNNPKVPAIIWAGYPGPEGGRAIADIIFGKYNPAGRLPITWYPANYVNQIPMTSMQLRPVPEKKYPGRTYRFYDGPVVYPFGYGLSYTNFRYQVTYVPKSIQIRNAGNCKGVGTVPKCGAIQVKDSLCKEKAKIVIGVANTENMDGDHVVLLFSTPPKHVKEAPLKRLVGFQRMFVKSKTSAQVEFNLNVCKSFSIVDADGAEWLPAGEHTIFVGQEGDKSSRANIVLSIHGQKHNAK